MKRDGLKDKILARYGSISEGSRQIGMERKKLCRILAGQVCTEEDILIIADGMAMTEADEIVRVFYPRLAERLPPVRRADTVSGPEIAEQAKESWLRRLIGRKK